MKDMVNILKYNLKKSKIASIVAILIYSIFVIGISSVAGVFIGTIINFAFLSVGLIFAPIVAFFDSTRKISRENALLFSAPIKSTSYIFAKLSEYIIDSLPMIIIFAIQCFVLNNTYLGIWSELDVITIFFLTFGLLYVLGFGMFMGGLFLFIITKKYIKKYWLNIIATIGIAMVIDGITWVLLELIYKIVPFYYVEVYGARFGILEMVVVIGVLIGEFILAKKVLDKGIDINQ